MVSISEVGYRKARTSGNGRSIQSLELPVLAIPTKAKSPKSSLSLSNSIRVHMQADRFSSRVKSNCHPGKPIAEDYRLFSRRFFSIKCTTTGVTLIGHLKLPPKLPRKCPAGSELCRSLANVFSG